MHLDEPIPQYPAARPTPAPVVCAWCRLVRRLGVWLLPGPGDPEPGDRGVSHGICPHCFDEQLRHAGIAAGG